MKHHFRPGTREELSSHKQKSSDRTQKHKEAESMRQTVITGTPEGPILNDNMVGK